jgi:recombination associated protein RdgC
MKRRQASRLTRKPELSSVTEDKATVRYVRHTLDEAEVARHIGAGKQCKKLALTWNDRISFVLDATLSIRKVKALRHYRRTERQRSQ